MGLGKICHEHCPRPGNGGNGFDGIGTLVAVAVLAMAGAALVALVWHYLVDIATAVGMLTIGYVVGYWWIVRPRRRARALAAGEAPQRLAYHRSRQVSRDETPAIQAGPQLHLPANLTGEETLYVLREMRREQ